MITLIQIFKMPVVVKKTIIENMKVQIGSAILQVGFQRITPAAIITPTD